jgi:hypothetical protein
MLPTGKPEEIYNRKGCFYPYWLNYLFRLKAGVKP